MNGTSPTPETSALPVLVRDQSGVRIITLNRPARLNAFTPESYGLLTSALTDAAASADVKVALLTGAGRAFSSGVDLQALAHAGTDIHEFSATFDVLIEALVAFPKPLVAAVQGAAVGFGFTLLLHCDLVLTATDARLRAPFTHLGTAPEAASSWLLPRAVGVQRAADLLLTSRWVSGREAVDLGLAARCYDPSLLATEAFALAQEIAALPGPAVVAAKRLLRVGWDDAVHGAMDRERRTATSLRSELGPLGSAGREEAPTG